MTARIILEGISYDDFIDGVKASLIPSVREAIRQEIKDSEAQRLEPVNKTDACRILGITYPTLIKLLAREGKTKEDIIYNKDIEIWKLKYPKYSR